MDREFSRTLEWKVDIDGGCETTLMKEEEGEDFYFRAEASRRADVADF